MYHCFLAIAAKFGYESGNQTCTIALIEYLNEKGKISIDSRFVDMFKYNEGEEKSDSVIGTKKIFLSHAPCFNSK